MVYASPTNQGWLQSFRCMRVAIQVIHKDPFIKLFRFNLVVDIPFGLTKTSTYSANP